MTKGLKIGIGITLGLAAGGYVAWNLIKTGVLISKVDGSVIWKQNWKYYKNSKQQLAVGDVADFGASDFDAHTEEITKQEYTDLKKLFLS